MCQTIKRLFKNKVFIIVVCLLLAGYFSFVVLGNLYQDQAETITVVRLKNNVEAGTLITKDMVTEQTIGAYGVANSVITDKNAVIGMYAAVFIFEEDNLTAEKLSDKTVEVTADQRLITISVSSAAAGGGGYVQSGDEVDIVAYSKDSETVEQSIQGVTVYSVKNDDMEDVKTVEKEKDKEPAYITLIVTPQQAEVLVAMEYSDKIHLLLRVG